MTGQTDLLFRAVLTPQRSASCRHRNTAIIVFAVFAIPVSIGFALVGAWPASMFIGLDIFLLAAFLHYHHFSGRMFETIELTRRHLTVERQDQWGRRRSWSCEPQWLRVHLEELDEHRNRLELRMRKDVLAVGSFLSTEDKAGLAATLRDKLSRVSVLHAR